MIIRSLKFYIIMITFPVFSCNAQFINNFGIKLGLNSTEVLRNWRSFYEWIHYERKLGSNYSFYIEKSLTSFIKIQSQIEYSIKGCTQYIESFNGSNIDKVKINNSLHYLSVPLFIKFIYNRKDKFHPYLFLGPKIEYLLKRDAGQCTINHYLDYSDPKEDNIGNFIYTSPLVEYFKTFQSGFTVGLGIEISNMLPRTILIEFFYDFEFFSHRGKESWIEYKDNSYVLMLGVSLTR